MEVILVEVENVPEELLEGLSEIESPNVAFIIEYTPNVRFEAPEWCGWQEINPYDMELLAERGHDILIKLKRGNSRSKIYKATQYYSRSERLELLEKRIASAKTSKQ